ncbi:MAG: HEAT repeat domain-containing protein [Candidatus Heimdallarchaeota archaeon]|nr:HEAT repeat domain-containing protein [Candidatus Heimdallarchaeota archaeon]MCK4611108.1 HEAT repeat domain-containing protein [Candidatus Heimdallarchaeota archaeon]
MTNHTLDSEEDEVEIILEELEEDSKEFVKSSKYEKKNLEIKDTYIVDTYESDEGLDSHIEDIQAEKIIVTSSEKIQEILNEYEKTRKNKDRVLMIDKIAELLPNSDLEEFLKEIAFKDSYSLCRVKAVSLLADLTDKSEVKRLLIRKLDDSSPKVRLWAVWGLRPIIHDTEIQEVFINKVKYFEKSKRVKLWLIRALSDRINDKKMQDTFLYLLKSKPDNETRKLLLFYLLQKANEENTAYELSRYVLKEANRDIRKEIVKKLVMLENEDVKYSLEKLFKTERDEEIREIIQTTF